MARLATQCSQKACSELMRLDWQTVGRIITRVVDGASRGSDRLDGLTLVIDHASGRLVWAEGRSRKVVDSFFEQLGPQRCAQISHVSSDGRRMDPGPSRGALPQRDHLWRSGGRMSRTCSGAMTSGRCSCAARATIV